jgi:hypothetical protein
MQLDTPTTTRTAAAPLLPTTAEVIPWPATFFERASAIRDFVNAIPEGAAFDAKLIDARFKVTTGKKATARVGEVEGILDTFAALGQLIPLESKGGRQYARPLRAAG